MTAWLAVCIVAPFAAAQTTAPATQRRTVRVGACERRLWLARVRGGSSSLSRLDTSGPITPAESFKAAVNQLTAVGDDAYVFLNDGSFFRCYDAKSDPAANLPGDRLAIDVTAATIDGQEALYALVDSAAAADLALYEPAGASPTSRPFDPGPAPLSVVRYSNGRWSAVAACPAIVTADAPAGRGPRLCRADNSLMLFWLVHPPHQISYFRLDPSTGGWSMGVTLGIPEAVGFWPTVVNRVPTLVAAVERGGHEELVVYRPSTRVGGGEPVMWRPADVQLSALPDGAGAVHYTDAFGFNQHLGVLAEAASGSTYIRFGRLDGAPALQTIDVFTDAEQIVPPVSLYQTLRPLILLGVLAAVLAFRRGSVVKPVTLPEDRALAFVMQRLLGLLIDLVPFAVVCALLLRVDFVAGVRELARWAFNPQMDGSGMPASGFMLWWCVSAGSYTVYSLLMELATGRTVGKTLLRVELLSEAGTRPGPAQIFVRNLMRLIEIMPPFWILGFFLVLSRNRQRVGDIFARTVAVRHIEPPSEETPTDGD